MQNLASVAQDMTDLWDSLKNLNEKEQKSLSLDSSIALVIILSSSNYTVQTSFC